MNIQCGNCINLMKSMDDCSVDLTLTDIPYEVVNRKSNGLRKLDKKDADISTFKLDEFLPQIVRVTKGSIYVFCSTEQVSQIRGTLVDFGLTTRLCIWKKKNPSPINGQYVWLSGVECCVFGKKKGGVFNEHCKNPVWEYPVVRKQLHPTQKPLDLFRYLVTVSSNVGDIVFDPCVGSGTTALAAFLEGRKFIAFDISEEYTQITRKRVEDAGIWGDDS